MIGGVWEEVVYDNMKNVVTCIKKRQKILNDEATRLACYYGFNINTANPRSGNEKGFVEGSVKYVRNQLFAKKYRFNSVGEVHRYMAKVLDELNKNSAIEEEKKLLKPANRPYLQCDVRICHVDHTSLVHINKHAYSVPEDLVNQELTAKIYLDHIDLFRKDEFICSHQKGTGSDTIQFRCLSFYPCS